MYSPSSALEMSTSKQQSAHPVISLMMTLVLHSYTWCCLKTAVSLLCELSKKVCFISP